MDSITLWAQDHTLAIIAIVLTLVFLYHYVIEKDSGIKLSKKYRNSIFEAQSKIFLNATQHLIVGNKNLAIKEFLNAVDINRETIETYFTLGGLFRSNGEIEKAIGIHRSLIARDNISESTRLKALHELAIDFDKGGFIDKAISTYEDVLKINRDQTEVILSLCRIHEDIEEWDKAYNYRLMLSKISHDDQSETISHILVQKAKNYLNSGNLSMCSDTLEDALRHAPSVSAKILKLRLYILKTNMDDAKNLLLELLKEHPMYATFIFVSLEEPFKSSEAIINDYVEKLAILKEHFLNMNDTEFLSSPSVILSKVRLLTKHDKYQDAYEIIKGWLKSDNDSSEVLKIEYIKILIQLGRTTEAVEKTSELLDGLHKSLARHFCKQCGYNSDDIFWRCPQCHNWETIQFRWKV